MYVLPGKTNHACKVFYGQAIRNKNVFICPVGAYAFYLMVRFQETHEFDEGSGVDFGDNSTWFDFKLLVEAICKDTKKGMTNKSYARWMEKNLKDNALCGRHIIHLGRIWGSVLLDMLENESTGTQQLGNWATTVRDRSYSIKLPIKTMRVKAGFQEADGMHFNVRTTVKPPEGLRRLIFPFVERGFEQVSAARAANRQAAPNFLATAQCFLELLDHLRDVALQDAATMMIKQESRTLNLLFEMPVFRTGAFKVSLVGC